MVILVSPNSLCEFVKFLTKIKIFLMLRNDWKWKYVPCAQYYRYAYMSTYLRYASDQETLILPSSKTRSYLTNMNMVLYI